MVHERDAAAGAHKASPDGPGWRGVAPVLAWSEEGPILGLLEARRPDPANLESLQEALAQSQAQCRRAAYLMATAGHDLRQPLQVIAMVLDALTPTFPDGRQLEWLEVARGELKCLSADLTDLAIAARLAEPEFVPLPLDRIIADAAGSWRHHAAARHLDLRILATPCTVRCDARLLTTILRNLIGNAIKHTRTGGVLVGSRRRPEGIRVDVIDTGPGLPQDELGRLFEPHQRGGPDVEGLGLGLAIVRDATERLGCDLSFQSTPGRGSRFSLTIPA